MVRSFYIAVVAIALTTLALGITPAAVNMCSNLMNSTGLHGLANTTITSATTVSGTFAPPGGKPIAGLPSFCRVTATLKPSPASDIKVEVWMPTKGWNGKLEGVGNGGLGGSISYVSLPNTLDHASLEDAIKSGYAAVSTDTGHVASDKGWLANEDKERDYGYRAIHEMTVTAKAAVQDFYGNAPKHSYFNGCSTGGGQGLGEAQQYPEDYDGILAGAPENYLTHSRANDLRQYQLLNSTDPPTKLSKATLSLVTQAVLARCGSDRDAAADGFLTTDPRECWFGPEELLCAEGDSPSSCLTKEQISLVMKMYGQYIVVGTHIEVMPGLPVGSEGPKGAGNVGWASRPYVNGSSIASTAAAQFYALGVLGDPSADFRKVDIGAAVQMADKKFPYINHTSVDLDAFAQHGGKLLIYHGWDDPDVTVRNSIDYYSSVVDDLRRRHPMAEAAGLAEVQKSARLFLVHGMGHCGGGPGPDNFDALGTLDQWVDHGAAPEKIVASHVVNGVKTFSRPLCPYPQIADYKEGSERKLLDNWTCLPAHYPFELYDRWFYGSLPLPGHQ